MTRRRREFSSEGSLTSRASKTAHTAVVARSVDKSYVCGCSTLPIDANGRLMRVGTTRDAEDVLRDGDYIGFSRLSGTTGEARRARRICRRLS
ncbi:hypothetical protein PF008_g18046 [Phytophthora fragariae]|uniref:PEP-utilising enzyme mobile domain-containing protein n=1 Tax=Phytophthora fragariae TaxID=53985 RepID=A0A6G0R6H2_9STRA|nr:hypothetical protein PF008_g18046 [Phytophthora fragariae]